MVVVVTLQAFESIYYHLPCFPVLNVLLTRVRFRRVNHTDGRLVEFDGFICPSLLDGIVLPHLVTLTLSFDIEVSCLLCTCTKVDCVQRNGTRRSLDTG